MIIGCLGIFLDTTSLGYGILRNRPWSYSFPTHLTFKAQEDVLSALIKNIPNRDVFYYIPSILRFSPCDILLVMKHIISSVLYLVILLCLSEFVFDPTNLYYELPWLDIPMHIMGGFGVASLALAVASYKKKTLSLTTVLIVYLCVAAGWELYELAHDFLHNSDWNGWSDTISDVINGGIGALVSYYLLKK